jgi:MarR family transcriptional regulator, organic hydroperoxide resistance regulator
MQGPLYWLRRAYFAGKKAYDEALAEHGLTASQLDLLRHVWQQEGIEQRALQEQLGVSSPTLTGVVDRLVERGVLERRLSAEDARVKQLFLTPAGHAIADTVAEIHARVEAQLMQGFTAAERALLEQWLRRTTSNVEGDDVADIS